MYKTSVYPWSESPEALAVTMQTSGGRGLSLTEVAHRQKQFGYNIFQRERQVSAVQIFLRQFANPLVIVLLIAVGCTIALSEWLDALIIGFAVLVNAVL